MIAKFEYLTKKQVFDIIVKIQQGLNMEFSSLKSHIYCTITKNIKYPVKNMTEIIVFGRVCFRIDNAGKCKYNLIIE